MIRKRNRLHLLRSNVKVMCRTHGMIERVTDAFQQPIGVVLELECGCRRREGAEREEKATA